MFAATNRFKQVSNPTPLECMKHCEKRMECVKEVL